MFLPCRRLVQLLDGLARGLPLSQLLPPARIGWRSGQLVETWQTLTLDGLLLLFGSWMLVIGLRLHRATKAAAGQRPLQRRRRE